MLYSRLESYRIPKVYYDLNVPVENEEEPFSERYMKRFVYYKE
jgi:hypothetical protein